MDEYVNDTRWTGRPMVESCDTTDFFEKDKVYRRIQPPQVAEQLAPQFMCMSIFVHPSTGVLYASGVFRSDGQRPWNPYPLYLVLSNWADGWVEIPKEQQ